MSKSTHTRHKGEQDATKAQHSKTRIQAPRNLNAGDFGLTDAELAGYTIDGHLLTLIERCPEFARGLSEGFAKALAAKDAGVLFPAGL